MVFGRPSVGKGQRGLTLGIPAEFNGRFSANHAFEVRDLLTAGSPFALGPIHPPKQKERSEILPLRIAPSRA